MPSYVYNYKLEASIDVQSKGWGDMSNFIYIAPTGDGWMNLARDGFFLDSVKKGDIILYFYVNTNAVIIGRNQNAWKECNLESMESDSVQLVRRHTGGGAVYHDTGNLNFSFIMHESDYDQTRQFNVIIDAMARLGLDAELSGRNDLLIDGKKFSGNAFGLSKGNRAHHGTILVNTDLDKLAGYLNVSSAKINAKGIGSVRSRVGNLQDFKPGVNIEMVRKAITDSFVQEYGVAIEYRFIGSSLADIEKRYNEQKSWDWRMGKTPQFDYILDNRFSFGEMQLHFSLRDGLIRDVKLYSDCLDTELCDRIAPSLVGIRFIPQIMSKALKSLGSSDADEIASYLEAKHL